MQLARSCLVHTNGLLIPPLPPPMLAMDHRARIGMRTSSVKTSTGRRPAPSINLWRLVAAHHLQVDAGNGPGRGSGDG